MSLVVVSDYVEAPFDIELSQIPRGWEVKRLADCSRKELRSAEVILVWHRRVDKELMDILPSCKLVVRYGVGYDAVDTKYLKEIGVPFCNNPAYGTEEVADTALAMILSLTRGVAAYDFQCRAIYDSWQENVIPVIRRSRSLSLGVIGTGRIGTAVIRRAHNFGFKIFGYDPYISRGYEKAVGFERCDDLKSLLASCDILTLHCPLNNQTRNMVDAEFVQSMKSSSYLVNTARGGLIESLDCIRKGIVTGHLEGCALDVLPDEPPVDEGLINEWKLLDPQIAGRLIINPHTAYYSQQSIFELRSLAAKTVGLFLESGTLVNRIA